uniref:LRAT domain-containing protein n=1 Tax=Stegastes partitus TaxID=144197 RepID=A0A3B5BEL1_9TELE
SFFIDCILIVTLVCMSGFCHSQPAFGDILAFDRGCRCVPPIYTHFAIYVGDRNLPHKNPGEDIFHHAGSVKAAPVGNCVFGRRNNGQEFQIDNSDPPNFTLNETAIINRINEKHRNCGIYTPWGNNCEHLVTYVRYGESSSKQVLTTPQVGFLWPPPSSSESRTSANQKSDVSGGGASS